MRKKYVAIMACVAVVCLLGAVGCKKKGPTLEFTDAGGSCGSRQAAKITLLDSEIIFSGTVSAPNPCRKLEATLEVDGSDVTVEITSRSGGGICTQCIAGINYSGKIFRLKPGLYKVTVDGETEEIRVK